MVKNGIDCIKISVRDMAESVAFFRDTIEMTVVADASSNRRRSARFGSCHRTRRLAPCT